MKFLVILAAMSLALAGGAARAADKPTIVLVHGAFETAEVWAPVEARLRQDGYKTIAVTLPGRPGNPLPAAQASLDAYRDAVLKAMAGEPNAVVLVGHSFGGMTISNVAEAAPDKVRTLVYVAAYLPTSGQTLVALSQADTGSKLGPAFRVADDKTTASVDPASRATLFCNGCDPTAAQQVAAGFTDEPLAPLATPVTLSAERFGRVDKVYVHTANDLVVSPALQAEMVAATPVRLEETLQTGHAPFAAAPDALAAAIEQAAR